MAKVTVIGSANVDFTIRLERLPCPGETVSGGEFYSSFGGKGANQALAAHRAGAQVRFIAKVGKDQHGDATIENLKKVGLDTGAVARDSSSHSGIALIMVDKDGHNSIAVAPGSNRNLTGEDIRRAEKHILWADVVLVQLEVPLFSIREAFSLAKGHDLLTMLNPAPACNIPDDILSSADVVTPNETELKYLSGHRIEDQRGIILASRKVLDSGPGQVIATLGENGCFWTTKDSQEQFPGFKVRAVDSTAAGDAFNGYLACALAERRSSVDAIKFASAAGALTVTRRGAQDSLPERGEVENMLRKGGYRQPDFLSV